MGKVVEVEVGDKGPLGALPEELQVFVDAKVAEARRIAEEKTERKLTPYLSDPAEMERLKQRDKELAQMQIEVAERDKKYEEAKKIREDAYAKEKAEAVSTEQQRAAKAVERLRTGVLTEIRVAAMQHGARPESLEELGRLLSADVDLDDEFNVYVVDPKDRKVPRVVNGNALTVEGLVADYLKTHPHHIAASPVKGGKAPGGATLAGRPPVVGDARSDARARVADDPSPANIGRLLRVATGAQQ